MIKSISKIHRSFSKVISIPEAVHNIDSDSTLLTGGFGVCGNPNSLLKEICKQKKGNLTVVSNNGGLDNYGIGLLLNNKLVKRVIGSNVGNNKEFER